MPVSPWGAIATVIATAMTRHDMSLQNWVSIVLVVAAVVLVLPMIAIKGLVVAMGLAYVADLNERMRSWYYIALPLFVLAITWTLMQLWLGVQWGPPWLTHYAASLFAPQVVAYLIFTRACSREIKQDPQTVRGTNVQINTMMFAQTIAFAVLLCWEALNHFVRWAPWLGNWDWWDVLLYALSFAYGWSITRIWSNSTARYLESLS